jgi:hypothetical protein
VKIDEMPTGQVLLDSVEEYKEFTRRVIAATSHYANTDEVTMLDDSEVKGFVTVAFVKNKDGRSTSVIAAAIPSPILLTYAIETISGALRDHLVGRRIARSS